MQKSSMPAPGDIRVDVVDEDDVPRSYFIDHDDPALAGLTAEQVVDTIRADADYSGDEVVAIDQPGYPRTAIRWQA